MVEMWFFNTDCVPQGLIPTPEEEEELRQMNEPLFNSIPDDLDFETNDPNQTIGITHRVTIWF